jgi:AcrR family transcriptional regulator
VATGKQTRSSGRTRRPSTGPSERTRKAGPRPRGRRRDAELDTAILDATLRVLAETGYEAFTVREVIARTGVSSATLYRRWPTARDLVHAALGSIAPEPEDVDRGSLEADLAEFLGRLGAALGRRQGLADLGHLGVASDPAVAELVHTTFVRPRQQALRRVLERARGRGELGRVPSIEDCWSLLVGPIHHRLFVRRARFTKAFGRTTVAFALAGLRALGPPPGRARFRTRRKTP